MRRSLLRLLTEDAQTVVSLNNGLSIKWKDAVPVEIAGNYRIVDGLGAIQADFDIRVVVPANYPYGFPGLWETSTKIPRDLDRHMFPDGKACLENPRRIDLMILRGISLCTFFTDYVHRFFCWQLVYDIDGPAALKGWAHGEEGIREFYCEILQTTDTGFIKEVLKRIVFNQLPGRNDLCFCGREEKFKQCHFKTISQLELITKTKLKGDLELWR